MPSTGVSPKSSRYISLKGVGEKFGVSERTAHKIVAEAWFPSPVALTINGRVRRWIEAEIDAAIQAQAPRQTERAAEPAGLARGRAERQQQRTGAPA